VLRVPAPPREPLSHPEPLSLSHSPNNLQNSFFRLTQMDQTSPCPRIYRVRTRRGAAAWYAEDRAMKNFNRRHLAPRDVPHAKREDYDAALSCEPEFFTTLVKNLSPCAASTSRRSDRFIHRPPRILLWMVNKDAIPATSRFAQLQSSQHVRRFDASCSPPNYSPRGPFAR